MFSLRSTLTISLCLYIRRRYVTGLDTSLKSIWLFCAYLACTRLFSILWNRPDHLTLAHAFSGGTWYALPSVNLTTSSYFRIIRRYLTVLEASMKLIWPPVSGRTWLPSMLLWSWLEHLKISSCFVSSVCTWFSCICWLWNLMSICPQKVCDCLGCLWLFDIHLLISRPVLPDRKHGFSILEKNSVHC